MRIYEDEKQCYIKAALEMGTPEEQEQLKANLDAIDWSVLDNLAHVETGQERGVFAPLDAVEVSEIEARKEEFREVGLKAIRECKVGAVLLAGGQGTRLGLDKPKGTLNIGLTKELYLFEQLVRNLQDVTNEAGAYVPFYIMTSNINNDDTIAFFKEHDYFGYPKEYVKFLNINIKYREQYVQVLKFLDMIFQIRTFQLRFFQVYYLNIYPTLLFQFQ